MPHIDHTFLVSQHDSRAFVASYNPEPTLDSHAASSSPTHHQNHQALYVVSRGYIVVSLLCIQQSDNSMATC